jgi:PadR family transcriptional regulator PadR
MILFTLLHEDSYGYAISKSIRETTGGQYSMKETTLYSAIARLERNGCIAAYDGKTSFGRPRTYYTLTDSGRALYREKRDEWAVTRDVIGLFMEGDET